MKKGTAVVFSAKRGFATIFACVMAVCFVSPVGRTVPSFARAEEIQTQELVSVTGASMRRGDKEADKLDKSGLLLESDGAYNGSVNGVFDGDTTIEFGFQNDEPFRTGVDFLFHITDATDSNNTFTVKYRTLDSWGTSGDSGAFVLYENQVRSSQYWGYEDTWYNTELATEGPMCSPMFSGYNWNHYGALKLVWEGDVLKIQVTQHNSASDFRTIAAFDGTQEFVAGTSWGLPKLSFPNGYLISFEAWDAGPDMCISSIASYGEIYDFSLETQNSLPRFYEEWTKIPLIDVDTTPITGVVGRETQLPEATVTLGGGTPESVYKVTVDGPEGSAVKNKDVTEELKFIPDVKGEYTITYQGVESFETEGEKNPNLVKVSCTAYEFSDPGALITKNENVKVEAGKTSISVASDGSASGLRTTFRAGESSFAFDTIFAGDFSLSLQADLMEVGGGFGEVRVRFSEYGNTGNYVDVVMLPGIASWRDWFTHMVVEYKGERFTTNYDDSDTVWNTEQIKEYSGTETAGWYEKAGITDFLARFYHKHDEGERNGVSGVGYIGFDSETLSFTTKYQGNEYTVASFTDEKYGWSNAFDGFKRGYTVEIIVKDAAEGASLTMTEMTGLDISRETLTAEESETYSAIFDGVEKEELEATQEDYYDEEHVMLYKRLGTGDVGFLSSVKKDVFKKVTLDGKETEKVDLTQVGKTFVLYYSDGITREITVLPDVTAPGLEWNIAAGNEIINPGDFVLISKEDVSASDKLDGNIPSEKVVITVKTPDSEGFTDYFDGFSFDKEGEYIIRYTVRDNAGNATFIDRTIFINSRVAPTLKIDGTIAQSGFTGGKISLPSASATIGDKQYKVTVVVSFDGKVISQKDASSSSEFTPETEGTYYVSYYSNDGTETPNETVRTFEIEISDDTIAPQIDVEFERTSANIGDTISLPAATATDNADGSVSVSVRVIFGNTEVAVTENQFTAEKYGTYTVIYTATDKAGNSQDIRFNVVVMKDGETQGGGGNESGGCGSFIAPWGISGAVLVTAAAVVFIKKKNV